MKKLFTLLCFLILSIFFHLSAQDFLTPCSYGVSGGLFPGYDETLFHTFLTTDNEEAHRNLSPAYFTFYLCMPSFDPEYVLLWRENELVLKKAKENLYYASEEIKSPDFRKKDKKVQKNKRELADSLKSDPVETYKLAVTTEIIDELEELFEHAVMTSNHLDIESHVTDGWAHYFGYGHRLAYVSNPTGGGRAGKIVSVVQNICYAVEKHDTARLNQQMETCRFLIQELKKEYPVRYFQPIWKSRSSGDKEPWSYKLDGDHCFYLEILSDTMTTWEILDSLDKRYSDSLAVWSRELFLMTPPSVYPNVVIDNHRTNAVCTVETKNGHTRTEITMPEKFWLRNVILEAAQLPIGEYYIDITCLDQTSGLYHWQENP